MVVAGWFRGDDDDDDDEEMMVPLQSGKVAFDDVLMVVIEVNVSFLSIPRLN